MRSRNYVPGILVQGRGLRGPKGDPGDITDASTYFQATSLMSDYVGLSHSHGIVSGHNITASSASNGLTLSVAALGAAANTLHAGDYVSMDVMGPSSTISITGLQPTGAYLTTAAGWDSVYQSAGAYLTTAAETDHTHGDFTTINTAGSEVKYSSSSNGFTLAIPAFITTANETWHSHTDAMSISERSNYFYTSNNTFANSTHIHGSIQTSPFAGSNVSVSSASSGVTLSVPAFITTAPSLSHTHGNSTISGFNIAGTMLSNGLTLSVPNFVHLSNSTHFVNTTVSNSFVRSWELEGAHTAGTTGSLLGSILYLSGGDNITLSGNGNTIVISGNASGGTGGVAVGNTDSVGFSTGSVIFAGTNITVNTSIGTGASSNSQFINLSAAAPVTGAIAALGNTATSNAFGSGSVMFSGSNITVNLSSNGASQWIQLVGADPSAAANEVITTAGGYLSLSIDGVSTLISATGLQPSAGMSDYIKVGGLIFSNSNGFSFGTSGAGSSTTVTGNWGSNLYFQEQYSSNLQHMSLTSLSLGVGYSTHTHGSNISFGNTSNSTETAIRASSSSNGVTLVVPSYLTTAANSTHTHGGTAYTSNTNLYSPAITGGIGVTSASSGWSVSLPPYLTTAAGVSHSHGNPTLSLSNLSGATASASDGLTISITGYPATSFVNVSDSGSVYFVNSLGSNITWGSTTSTGNITYIGATAGGGAGTGFSSGSTSAGTEIKGTLNSNGLSIVYPAYLTTGGAGGGLGAFELSGNTSGSTTVSGSTVQLYGGNNITLSGYDGSKIRIDGAQGSVYFSDGNGISFGSSTSGISTTITGSIEASLLTLSNYAGIQSTGITGGSATINSSQILINVPTYYSATSEFNSAFPGTGFTTTATTGTAVVGTNNSLGLRLGMPAYLTTQSGQVISASNGSYTYSVLSFGTANNVSFYSSEAGGLPSIVASINTSLRQYVYGNTSGVSSQSATNIAFKGGSNITLSIGTDKQIEIIGGAGGGGNQTLSVLNGLWTYTGYDNSASISNELYYRGFGLMSMAFDPTEPSINFIVDEEHLPKFVASNNSHTGRGEIYFANSNGISFGLSGGAGTNSYNATITASVIAGSGGGGVAISASNSSVSGGTVVFSNSNNVNFGLNGSTITASATGLALAGHTHGGTSLVSSATSNSTENLMRFVSASDGLTFIQPAFLTTAMASNESHIRRIAVSGSNYESGSVEISGSRNVTVTYNDSTISIYGPANILNSFSVSGNTGTTGSSAISGGGFVIAGGSNITLSQSNNSISIHGATANGPASVVFSDSNGMVWGSSSSGSTTTVTAVFNQGYILTGNNTAGTTSFSTSGSNLVLSGGNNITLSGNSNNQIVISAGAGGGVALGNTATIPFTSGSVMLSGVNLTVNTSSTGASQYLQISAPAIGYLYFSNTNGHSWSSSTSGVSTSIYIVT